jgi:hypothetical protein
MSRTTSEEYLAKLEELESIDEFSNEGQMSEAERLAMLAEKPRVRIDGHAVGSMHKRERQLTAQQTAFAMCLIRGATLKVAYREAYPNSQATDACVMSNASKLAKDLRIKRLVNDGVEETIEHLSEDVAGTKRYVLKQLLAHSKEAKQEGTKLKALELLGKSVGLFIDKTQAEVKQSTPDELKRELASHLKLLNNVRPLATGLKAKAV